MYKIYPKFCLTSEIHQDSIFFNHLHQLVLVSSKARKSPTVQAGREKCSGWGLGVIHPDPNPACTALEKTGAEFSDGRSAGWGADFRAAGGCTGSRGNNAFMVFRACAHVVWGSGGSTEQTPQHSRAASVAANRLTKRWFFFQNKVITEDCLRRCRRTTRQSRSRGCCSSPPAGFCM